MNTNVLFLFARQPSERMWMLSQKRFANENVQKTGEYWLISRSWFWKQMKIWKWNSLNLTQRLVGKLDNKKTPNGHRETLGRHEISNVNSSTRNAQRWITFLVHLGCYFMCTLLLLERIYWLLLVVFFYLVGCKISLVRSWAVLRTPSTAKSLFKEKMTTLTAGNRTSAV